MTMPTRKKANMVINPCHHPTATTLKEEKMEDQGFRKFIQKDQVKERKEMNEKKCLRCQRLFKYPKDMNPVPNLCRACESFFRHFNKIHAPKENKIHKIIPKVTKNVTEKKN